MGRASQLKMLLGAASMTWACTGWAEQSVPRPVADAEAAYRLGRAYKVGDGVRADNHEAERWLARAALQGHSKAGAEYGLVLMQNGSPAQALPWLRKAADHGDPRAQYGLGTLLFAGNGVKQDRKEARRWIVRAAQSKLPAAIEALQIMDSPEPLAGPAASIAAMSPKPSPSVSADKGWAVQLGAFANPDNARRHWKEVRKVGGTTASLNREHGLTQLRVGPFASRASASRYCAAERALKRECIVLKEARWLPGPDSNRRPSD